MLDDKCTTWGFVRPEKMPWLPVAESHEPYQQGSLDSLCGIYAVANAVTYLCKLPAREAVGVQLMAGCIEPLEQHAPIRDVLLEGIGDQLMAKVLRQFVAPTYGISIRRPYYLKMPPLDECWQTIRQFTAGGGVVLMGDEDHWTVIYSVSAKRMYLLDSCGAQFRTRALYRRRALLGRYLYFMSVDGGMAHG